MEKATAVGDKASATNRMLENVCVITLKALNIKYTIMNNKNKYLIILMILMFKRFLSLCVSLLPCVPVGAFRYTNASPHFLHSCALLVS